MANENSPMFHYWTNVLEAIKKVLIFIRSFREANFIMMISALEQLIPLFFALDHTHYTRWASVFLQDLKELKWKQPEFYSITEAHKKLGGDVADAMPVFHSFSGCDSVSAFFGHSKTAQYKAWINHSKSTELTAALRGLSCCSTIETG